MKYKTFTPVSGENSPAVNSQMLEKFSAGRLPFRPSHLLIFMEHREAMYFPKDTQHKAIEPGLQSGSGVLSSTPATCEGLGTSSPFHR